MGRGGSPADTNTIPQSHQYHTNITNFHVSGFKVACGRSHLVGLPPVTPVHYPTTQHTNTRTSHAAQTCHLHSFKLFRLRLCRSHRCPRASCTQPHIMFFFTPTSKSCASSGCRVLARACSRRNHEASRGEGGTQRPYRPP